MRGVLICCVVLIWIHQGHSTPNEFRGPIPWQKIPKRDRWAKESTRIAVKALIGYSGVPFSVTNAEAAGWNAAERRYNLYRICFKAQLFQTKSCRAVVHWTPRLRKGIHIDFPRYSKCVDSNDDA